jgi:hypothetical protein
LNLINRYEKNNWSFLAIAFFIFAKANHGMLPKSKEIITMELQNELKLHQGMFWCTEAVSF